MLSQDALAWQIEDVNLRFCAETVERRQMILEKMCKLFTILCLMKFCLPSNRVSVCQDEKKIIIRLIMLCLSGFEQYSRSWVPLTHVERTVNTRIQDCVYCIMFSIL